MAQETKKIKWWIPTIIIALLVGAGVGVYLLIQKNKRENTPAESVVEKEDPCKGYPKSYRKGGFIVRETCDKGNISRTVTPETKADKALITNAPIPVGGLI